jgi:arylsulfatase A-like enzyme
MRTSVVCSFWIAALLAAPCVAAEKPNVVVFLVDDMGWQDTSVPFHTQRTPWNERYRTPNMERLAAQGMKFTQAYACPVCTPTRVSLLTGLSAARHRATNWTFRQDTPTDAKHPLVQPPAWNVNGLSPDPATPRAVCSPTLPQLLREAGYRTILVGKAHFGAVGTPGAEPRNLGFDVNIASHAAGAPASYLGEQNYSAGAKAGRAWDVPGLEKYHGTDTFLTEALTIEARKAVDQAVADGKPFFLYLAHYAVHVPYSPDKRFVQKYRDAGLEETEAMYAALLEGMDKSLGDILDNLERHRIADKTIVVFLSDNGGLSAPQRGGKPHTHNAPLSSGKGSAREGGIRMPMLVKWPGVTRPGSVCHHYVICEDLLPSILEMTGADQAVKKPPVDGLSYVPLLKQAPGYPSDRALVWHYPNIWGPTGPGIGPFSAIRHGDWKLIYYHADQHFELFNLADDLSEEHNLASEKPERLKELAAELSARLKSVGAQMPTSKKTGRAVPLPDAVAETRAAGR